jgi:hypothetical protein
MKQLSLRTGLLALLAFMTLLLLAVSFMGIVAINKGNRSLDVINRIQGDRAEQSLSEQCRFNAGPRERGAGGTKN